MSSRCSNGNPAALRACFDRILLKPRAPKIAFALPPIRCQCQWRRRARNDEPALPKALTRKQRSIKQTGMCLYRLSRWNS